MAEGRDAGTPAGRMLVEDHGRDGDGHTFWGKKPLPAPSAPLCAHAMGVFHSMGLSKPRGQTQTCWVFIATKPCLTPCQDQEGAQDMAEAVVLPF